MSEKEFTFVLMVLYLIRTSGKRYVWLGLKKARQLSLRFYNVQMSPRTMDRVIADLKEGSFIKRRQRPGKKKDGSYDPKSALTWLTFKALFYLKKRGIQVDDVIKILLGKGGTPKVANNVLRTRSISDQGKCSPLSESPLQDLKGGPSGTDPPIRWSLRVLDLLKAFNQSL